MANGMTGWSPSSQSGNNNNNNNNTNNNNFPSWASGVSRQSVTRTSPTGTLPHWIGNSPGRSPPMGASPTAGVYQGHNVWSERLMSSTILKEEILQTAGGAGRSAEDNVRYVEVPYIEEVIKQVPRKEYVEVEKRVPKYEVEWVERTVEVPKVEWVDRHVEVPQIKEMIRFVPMRKVVEVPREVCKYVPKVETRVVEREVEVPGEVIEVPYTTVFENKVIVPRYIDQEVTCVVAQSLRPVIIESDTHCVDVELREFNPCLVPVDVMVPRPVARHLIAHKKTEEHKVVEVPMGHYNAMLKEINHDLNDRDLESSFQTNAMGIIPIATGVRFVPVTGDE